WTTIVVHRVLYGSKDIRSALHLINHSLVEIADEARRIITRSVEHCFVVQADIDSTRINKLADQCGLAALPRTNDRNDRCIFERRNYAFGREPLKKRGRKVGHLGVLISGSFGFKAQQFRIISPAVSDSKPGNFGLYRWQFRI